MKKILIVLFFVCTGCGINNISSRDVLKTSKNEIQNISMIQLIANPTQFHHAKVRIIGFAIIQFEGTAIFLSQEFAEHTSMSDAIWLDIDQIEQYQQYNQQYILVEGTFNKDLRGHLSQFSGTITNITRFELWGN
jgi:hypothetical protein